MIPAAREYLVEKYVHMRQEDTTGTPNNNFIFNWIARNSYRLTVRQLESMLRLSEALAKLYFSDTIEVAHVKEAHNLMKLSIVTIDREREEFDEMEEKVLDLNMDGINMDEGQGEDMNMDQVCILIFTYLYLS